MDKALRLLSMFVSEETVRVRDAAEMVGVATGTPVLAMLLYRGYLTQDLLSNAYGPGPVLLSIAHGPRVGST